MCYEFCIFDVRNKNTLGCPENLGTKRKDYARVKESSEHSSENHGYPCH